MSKRKREKSDIESAEGAKHKRVKERLKSDGKSEDHQRTVGTAPKAPEDNPLAPSVESQSKASKRPQAKLERTDQNEVESLRTTDEDRLRPVSTVAKALEHTRSAPEMDHSNKALRRREAKLEKRRKKHHKGQNKKSSIWKVSEATGGQMLDLDPLFSEDEA